MRVIVSKLITSHDRKQDEQWRIRLLITELLLRGFDPTDENNALIYTAIGRRDKLFLKLLINAPTVFLPEALEIFEFLTERMNGSSVSLEDLMNTLDKWREDVKIALRKYHATNSKTQLSGHFERWFQNPPLKKSTKTKLEYYRGSLSRLSTPASVRIFGSAITEQVQRLANQVQQGLDYLFEKWAYRYLITIRDIQERNLVSL